MMRFLLLAAAVLCITAGVAEARSKKKLISHHKARQTKPVVNSPVAKEIFGHQTKPSTTAQPRAIGSYAKGCLAGAQPLPVTASAWQAMRLSRNRDWGHPVLLKYIERLATDAQKLDGWPGLLVGDLSQPMGGPMLTGHASHQIGLDVDIWLKQMPPKTLSPEERETEAPVSMLGVNGLSVNPAVWTQNHFNLIKRAASYANVARIFVHPAIKKALCEGAGVKTAPETPPAATAAANASAPSSTPLGPENKPKILAKAKGKGKAKTSAKASAPAATSPAAPILPEQRWLAKVRAYWGHHYHFHVRLSCPAGMAGCENQPPLPGDLGCGKELESWLKLIKGPPKPEPTTPPVQKHPLTMADLPAECSRLVGFDPKSLAAAVPMGAGTGGSTPLPERKPSAVPQAGQPQAAPQPQPAALSQPQSPQATLSAQPAPPLPTRAQGKRPKPPKGRAARAAKAATFTPAPSESN